MPRRIELPNMESLRTMTSTFAVPRPLKGPTPLGALRIEIRHLLQYPR